MLAAKVAAESLRLMDLLLHKEKDEESAARAGATLRRVK